VHDKDLATHSVVVLPFLNLDDGSADLKLGRLIARALQEQATELGISRVRSTPEPPPKWTGIGELDEIRRAANQFHARAVLAGTTRRIGNQTRLSLRLVKENGNDVMRVWTVDVNPEQDIGKTLAALGAGHQVYNLLSGNVDPVPADEGMRNETARGYLNAGLGLLDRRTIADMDRAIACFQGAVHATPRSVAAHSYLALAYLGRNLLTRNPLFVERAFEAANEAARLSPNNSSANRSLAALHILAGHYAEALEHGFRSLEAANPGERAFGHIAYAWKMLGRPDTAILWFQKAKVNAHQPADYDALIGDCWSLLGADTKAQESFATAARFRPDLPEGWLGLCNLKLIQGDLVGSKTLYQERALEYEQFHAAKQMEAEIEFFSRDFAHAEKLYTELQQRDADGDGTQQYGIISYKSALARLKRDSVSQSAATLLKECLATDTAALAESPRHPEVLYRLAATEAIAMDTQSALRHLQAAIDAGWSDYRSPRLDPRFDSLARYPGFQSALDDLAARMAELRKHFPENELLETAQ
jgi:tetratricopeptide (TPR) repeat protein